MASDGCCSAAVHSLTRRSRCALQHANCSENQCCKQKVGLHVYSLHMHGQLHGLDFPVAAFAHLDWLLCAMLGSEPPSQNV